MRYIVLALALCFALPSAPAMAANKPVKHKPKKVKRFKPHKVGKHHAN
jgi:hypothetical protein